MLQLWLLISLTGWMAFGLLPIMTMELYNLPTYTNLSGVVSVTSGISTPPMRPEEPTKREWFYFAGMDYLNFPVRSNPTLTGSVALWYLSSSDQRVTRRRTLGNTNAAPRIPGFNHGHEVSLWAGYDKNAAKSLALLSHNQEILACFGASCISSPMGNSSQWHLVCLTWECVDGEISYSLSLDGGEFKHKQKACTNCSFVNNVLGWQYKGWIDEFTRYDSVLTQSTVANLYLVSPIKNCSGHGAPISNTSCNCTSGWGGQICDELLPPTVTSTNLTGCKASVTLTASHVVAKEFIWSATIAPGMCASPGDSISANMTWFLISNGTQDLTIPRNILQPATSYVVSVIGKSGHSWSLPTTTCFSYGDNVMSVRTTVFPHDFVWDVGAELIHTPHCACNRSMDISFGWELTDRDAGNVLMTKSGPDIAIPVQTGPLLLTAYANLTFVRIPGFPPVMLSVVTPIFASPGYFQPRIKSGNRTWPASRPLILEVVSPAPPLSVLWTCSHVNASQPCQVNPKFMNSSILVIPPFSFSPGAVFFTAQVMIKFTSTKALNFLPRVCITIANSSSIPQVMVDLAGDTSSFSVDPGAPFRLQTSVVAPSGDAAQLQFKWQMSGQPLPLTSTQNSPNLVLPPNSLRSGQDYSFSLTVTDPKAGGEPAVVGVAVRVEVAPHGGTCFISPSAGIALETLFQVNCSGWHGNQEPLVYCFHLHTTPPETRALIQRGTSSTAQFLLAPSPSTNITIIDVQIEDLSGSFTTVSLEVMVFPPPLADVPNITFDQLLLTDTTPDRFWLMYQLTGYAAQTKNIEFISRVQNSVLEAFSFPTSVVEDGDGERALQVLDAQSKTALNPADAVQLAKLTNIVVHQDPDLDQEILAQRTASILQNLVRQYPGCTLMPIILQILDSVLDVISSEMVAGELPAEMDINQLKILSVYQLEGLRTSIAVTPTTEFSSLLPPSANPNIVDDKSAQSVHLTLLSHNFIECVPRTMSWTDPDAALVNSTSAPTIPPNNVKSLQQTNVDIITDVLAVRFTSWAAMVDPVLFRMPVTNWSADTKCVSSTTSTSEFNTDSCTLLDIVNQSARCMCNPSPNPQVMYAVANVKAIPGGHSRRRPWNWGVAVCFAYPIIALLAFRRIVRARPSKENKAQTRPIVVTSLQTLIISTLRVVVVCLFYFSTMSVSRVAGLYLIFHTVFVLSFSINIAMNVVVSKPLRRFLLYLNGMAVLFTFVLVLMRGFFTLVTAQVVVAGLTVLVLFFALRKTPGELRLWVFCTFVFTGTVIVSSLTGASCWRCLSISVIPWARSDYGVLFSLFDLGYLTSTLFLVSSRRTKEERVVIAVDMGKTDPSRHQIIPEESPNAAEDHSSEPLLGPADPHGSPPSPQLHVAHSGRPQPQIPWHESACIKEQLSRVRALTRKPYQHIENASSDADQNNNSSNGNNTKEGTNKDNNSGKDNNNNNNNNSDTIELLSIHIDVPKDPSPPTLPNPLPVRDPPRLTWKEFESWSDQQPSNSSNSDGSAAAPVEPEEDRDDDDVICTSRAKFLREHTKYPMVRKHVARLVQLMPASDRAALRMHVASQLALNNSRPRTTIPRMMGTPPFLRVSYLSRHVGNSSNAQYVLSTFGWDILCFLPLPEVLGPCAVVCTAWRDLCANDALFHRLLAQSFGIVHEMPTTYRRKPRNLVYTNLRNYYQLVFRVQRFAQTSA